MTSELCDNLTSWLEVVYLFIFFFTFVYEFFINSIFYLQRLKETLENDKKKYAEKVNILVMTWERVAQGAREQKPLAAICIVEKMYK